MGSPCCFCRLLFISMQKVFSLRRCYILLPSPGPSSPLTRGSCVTCFGQLNVGRDMFVTLGRSLNCQRFTHSLSCCHGNWHQQMMAVPPAEEPKVKVAVVTTWELRPRPVCERTQSLHGQERILCCLMLLRLGLFSCCSITSLS